MPLHHEESDVDIRAILRFGAWLAIVMVGAPELPLQTGVLMLCL